jgi:hypothetical protein
MHQMWENCGLVVVTLSASQASKEANNFKHNAMGPNTF